MPAAPPEIWIRWPRALQTAVSVDERVGRGSAAGFGKAVAVSIVGPAARDCRARAAGEAIETVIPVRPIGRSGACVRDAGDPEGVIVAVGLRPGAQILMDLTVRIVGACRRSSASPLSMASWERSWEKGYDLRGTRDVIDEAGLVGTPQLAGWPPVVGRNTTLDQPRPGQGGRPTFQHLRVRRSPHHRFIYLCPRLRWHLNISLFACKPPRLLHQRKCCLGAQDRSRAE